MIINVIDVMSSTNALGQTEWRVFPYPVDLSNFQTAFNSYGANDFPFKLNHNSGFYLFNDDATIGYNWIIENNYIKITFIDSLSIPSFNVDDVTTLEYRDLSDPWDPEISEQPLSVSIAYRPIVFYVEYSPKPPVAYCDIYFDGVYYKTLSKTVPEHSNIFSFDISDAAQEYLKSELAPINGSELNVPNNYFAECYCKFRTSHFDSNGFIQQQIPIPVQATNTSNSISGGGIQSDNFIILNATLQHENNQNIINHLLSVKGSTTGNEIIDNFLPLTHRPKKSNICLNDSDYFPTISLLTFVKYLRLYVTYKDSSEEVAQVNFQNENLIIDVPSGTMNLKELFLSSNIVWENIISYKIILLDDDDLELMSFEYEINCCCNNDKIRIHFINSLGRVDAMNFNHKEETLDTKSDTWQKSLSFPLVKSDGGFQRFNMKSNETYKATNICYREEDMEWVKELFNSPRAWIEWKGAEGQPDAFIPIIVSDKKIITRKKDDRYIYEINIDFSMANENIHLRN